MQKSCFIVFLSCWVFFAAAQKVKPPAYFYTQASEKYFTDAETDSLLRSFSQTIFEENNIPKPLFDKHFSTVKKILTSASQFAILQAFKDLEKKAGKNIYAAAGTPSYTANKKLYEKALEEQVRNAFRNNLSLSKYLYSSTNDRITSFNSTIRVGTDGKLLVTEKIRVFNGNGSANPIYGKDPLLPENGMMNDEIKRGLVRAFPLYYTNKYKLFQNTTFKLKQVLRDGQKEDYHTEKKDNGILVYTGSEYKFLSTGYYTYTITYETDHQLKFLHDYDELYWNVTGTSWSFRIDSAKCTIILPKGAATVSSKCYTGAQGSASEDCSFSTATTGDSTVIVFKTTKSLLPKQGITISTSWSKGFVKGPGTWQQIKYYIWNNKAVFFLPFAAIFSAIFCFIFWWRYGRDPKKGTVYPLFEPPAGYSPAALGYIYYKKYSRQLTAATIVDAAVRNKIKIDVEREGRIFKHNEYHISKSNKASKPPQTQYNDFDSDIEDLVGTTIEKGKYNSDLGDLNKTVQKHCEETYKNKDGGFRKGYRGMFSLNSSYTALPIFVCVALGIWAFVGGLVKALIVKNFWQIAYFIGGWILCVLVLRIFSKMLTAYSPEGRKLMDKIEGFRMFLSTAEENRFDTMNPPKKSLELYEKYLPFAIALGCEIEWGQKFEDIINTAYLGGTAASSFSQSFTRDNNSFSSSFASSFSGAISSASSPPSSSSGGGSSFGGGSSGGGGGGGGGGGW